MLDIRTPQVASVCGSSDNQHHISVTNYHKDLFLSSQRRLFIKPPIGRYRDMSPAVSPSCTIVFLYIVSLGVIPGFKERNLLYLYKVSLDLDLSILDLRLENGRLSKAF